MLTIIGIDPAKINIGITVAQYVHNHPLRILSTERVAYKSDVYFTRHLHSLIRTHGQQLPVKIVIERQPHNSSISSNMRYVQGYFTALGVEVIFRMPITHGLHISSYKDRKNHSLSIAIERLAQVEDSHVLAMALQTDDRKHDIADSFNLVFEEWFRIVSNELIKSNKKH